VEKKRKKNKLQVWVWQSPKLQKGASIVMHNKLHAWVGTASAEEVGKMQYSSFFLRCLCSERSCHRFLLFPRITMSCALPREMDSPPHVATVYNKLIRGAGGCCVSFRVPSLPGPSFMHVWSSVCGLFWHPLSLPVNVSRTSSCGMQEKSICHNSEMELGHTTQ
jgi:hypothetical protein